MVKEVTYLTEGKFYKGTFPEINIANINLSQLKRNVDIIRSKLKPETKFLAVVKGDAYGHGLVPIAHALECFNCDAFGVVRLTEALALRRGGISLPILMLSPVAPKQASWIVENNITAMVDNVKIVSAIQEAGASLGTTAKIHVKINTGLNRYGIEPGEAVNYIRKIKERCPNIEIEGLYTHFKDPNFDRSFTQGQINKFNNVVQELQEKKLRPPMVHAAGSAGILKYPESHYDMVRCGIILYGLEHKEDENLLPKGVMPIMTIKSSILKMEKVKAGESVGYGNKFIASRDSRIAIVGVGYGDGISRGWNEVIISGQKVPAVSYFMDGIIVDITDIKQEVKEFDEVVIVGNQGEENISWQEACHKMNAYIDEQVQSITERVPKQYYYEDPD